MGKGKEKLKENIVNLSNTFHLAFLIRISSI